MKKVVCLEFLPFFTKKLQLYPFILGTPQYHQAINRSLIKQLLYKIDTRELFLNVYNFSINSVVQKNKIPLQQDFL